MATRLNVRTSTVPWFLLLATSVFAFPASAAELEFPDTLGPFKHARFIDFELEQSGRGYSHSYYDVGATASLFVYPRDGVTITSLEEPAIQAEFEFSANELEKQLTTAGFESLEIVERGRVASIADSHSCLSILVSYTDGTTNRITWLCLLPFGEDFLKLRYTVLPENRDQQRAALAQFQAALAQFIDTALVDHALAAVENFEQIEVTVE